MGCPYLPVTSKTEDQAPIPDSLLNASLSEGGPAYGEYHGSTLNLYLDLLRLWVDEVFAQLKQPNPNAPEDSSLNQRMGQFSTSNFWSQVDRIEAQGMVYLCSPSHHFRSCCCRTAL